MISILGTSTVDLMIENKFEMKIEISSRFRSSTWTWWSGVRSGSFDRFFKNAPFLRFRGGEGREDCKEPEIQMALKNLGERLARFLI